MAESKNYYLICYDIRDPKRWRKAFKLLKGYCENIQFSIFRVRLNQRDREQLRWKLEQILAQEDSLLIAGLCKRCVERIEACNRPEAWEVEHDLHEIFYARISGWRSLRGGSDRQIPFLAGG